MDSFQGFLNAAAQTENTPAYLDMWAQREDGELYTYEKEFPDRKRKREEVEKAMNKRRRIKRDNETHYTYCHETGNIEVYDVEFPSTDEKEEEDSDGESEEEEEEEEEEEICLKDDNGEETYSKIVINNDGTYTVEKINEEETTDGIYTFTNEYEDAESDKEEDSADGNYIADDEVSGGEEEEEEEKEEEGEAKKQPSFTDFMKRKALLGEGDVPVVLSVLKGGGIKLCNEDGNEEEEGEDADPRLVVTPNEWALADDHWLAKMNME